jgi:mono/diheme cytochrome c family protein
VSLPDRGRVFVVGGWVVGLMLAGAAVHADDESGDVERGRVTYLRVGCYECHGTRGAGGGIAGPAIAPRLVPREVFSVQLRNPARGMPPYAVGVLSQQDISDLYAYLRSLPQGRPASEIPELNY